jgi:hypothetical protein
VATTAPGVIACVEQCGVWVREEGRDGQWGPLMQCKFNEEGSCCIAVLYSMIGARGRLFCLGPCPRLQSHSAAMSTMSPVPQQPKPLIFVTEGATAVCCCMCLAPGAIHPAPLHSTEAADTAVLPCSYSQRSAAAAPGRSPADNFTAPLPDPAIQPPAANFHAPPPRTQRHGSVRGCDCRCGSLNASPRCC